MARSTSQTFRRSPIASRTARPFTARRGPLARAVAALLAAGGALGGAQAQPAFSSAWFAAKGAVQQTAAQSGKLPNGLPATGVQPPRAPNANAMRSLANLNLAAQGIAAQQAAQAAARAAALAAQSDVPDGLGAGGLNAGSLVQGWVNANGPVQTVAGAQTEVKIQQTGEKAILNWETFNVGKNTVVNFDQSAGTLANGHNNWVALNRVNDPSGRPSEIAGQIKADGSVYIVNRNGIIFNGSSQVNTRGLIASSLALTDRQFMRGINNPESLDHVWAGSAYMPVFGDHTTTAPTFNEADDWTPTEPTPGHVVVRAGAELKVNDGGKLMLFGTQVRNAGALSVKDGQIIMAAGEQVWLGEDLNGARGLDVAVSGPLPSLLLQQNVVWIMSRPNWQSSFLAFDVRMRDVVFPALDARAQALGYQVTNTGTIHADRGNITLQSRDVNQTGVITATTALNNRDGSIRLRAWGQGSVFHTSNAAEAYGNFAMHWAAGSLTLGQGSVALILPDAGDTSQIEATDLATRYTPGSIALHGKLIDLQPGSLVMAPSGNIDIVAASNPFHPTGGSIPSTEPGYGQAPRDGSRIYIDSGAVVSVAGLQDVAVAMSRNFIEVDLRINELRDSPLLRDSWLRGQKLIVDRRESGAFAHGPMAGVLWGGDAGAWVGTPLADVSAWLGVGKTDLQELATTGGSIELKAGGSLVTREGSLLDISGGSVRYQDGMNTASKLMGADGRVYTMANAGAGMAYTGIAGQYVSSNARWGVTETFVSPLIGGARHEAGYVEGRNAGSLQMYISNGAVLEGDIAGSVVAGDRQRTGSEAAKAGGWQFGGGGNIERAWLLGHLVISDTPEKLGADFTATSALDSRFVRSAPLDSTTWMSTDALEKSGLGKISLFVSKGFTLEEGTALELGPRTSFAVTSSADTGIGLVFNIGGSIRSAGGQVALSNVHVDGGRLVLGEQARIDVGGQWINELLGGYADGAPALDGGSIILSAPEVVIEGRTELVVNGGGRVWLDKGKRRLAVGDAGSIQLSGFRSQDVAQLDMQAFAAGSGGALRLTVGGAVQAGGDPAALPQAMHLPADLYGSRGFRSLTIESTGSIDIAEGTQLSLVPLGWDMAGVDHAAIASGSQLADVMQPTLLRPELRLKNDAAALDLTAGGGALRLGAGAAIRVDTGGSVTLTASAVDLLGTIEAPAGSINLSGSTATLAESARLLARGAAVLYKDARGLGTGTVLDGGSVSLRFRDLLLEQGSLIDVSGVSGVLETGSARAVQAHSVASNGGSIRIAGQGLMASTLVGHAGGAGAHGGNLSLEHVSPPGGGNLADQLVQNFCGSVGYCTVDSIAGVDFAAVLESYGIPGMPPMIIPKAVFDQLGDAARVGLSVSDTAAPGSAPGQAVDVLALGMTQEAVDLFRDWFGIDFSGMTPVNSLLAARPAAFAQGGFANLRLASSGSVELGNVHLTATQSIAVDGVLRRAPAESGDASLTAPYLLLQRTGSAGAPGPTANRMGHLVLNADVAEVRGGADGSSTLGPASIRGFAETALNASELRFSVASYAADLKSNPRAADASLNVDGALTLHVGQVYPATGVNAGIVSGESITVRSNGQATAAPLSAGGALTLKAPVIGQHGVLRAPFGQITLDASERLVLGAGSLTSVSGADLLLPYGQLLNNEYWAGPFDAAEGTGMAMLPEKRITLTSPVVDSAQGSVIDIRGGGELFAREFVPGTGGSHDLLTLSGAFAVVPGHVSPVAPGGGSGVAGERIWLAGGNGLQAGWYTLMPASYAALPGAWLVMPTGAASSFNPPAGTAALADGSVVMAGRRSNGFDGSGDAKTSFWQVMSSTQVRQYSEYNQATASSFFSSGAFKLSQYRLTGLDVVTPRLPGDGGSVVFKAGQLLVLDGQLLSQADAGGRGGLVDIAGQKIAVVGAGEDVSDLQAAGYLLIDADKLTGFGAGSLLVGGMRSGHALGLGVEVSASDIVVRNGSDSALSGAEIILAAFDRVQIDDGSVVLAQGGAAQAAGDLIIAPQQKEVWQVNDNGTSWDPSDDFSTLVTPSSDWGALVRVSTGPAIKVVRENVDITRGGVVNIGEGAVLSGEAALLIDATRSTVLAGSARLSGAALSVASSRIGLGGGSEGLVLGEATLAQLANTGELTLRSYSSIDFHDDVDFSRSGLKSVVLDAARLAGHSGDVVVNAGKLTLANSGAQAAAGVANGGGALSLGADELVLGAGAKAIEGFATVALRGQQRIVAQGRGSLDTGAAQLELDTPVLTGQQGASQAITTAGALTVAGDTGAPVTGTENSLGASLALTGGSVDVRGRIVALGGAVSLTALTGDLVLRDGSFIDAGGFAKDFFDVFAYANAGRIQLTAEQGSVRHEAGAALNLSAHAGGGNAGTLTVKTSDGGSVELAGALAARAGAGGKGGSFTLDVAELQGFGALGQRLNDAGFSAARAFRVRSGDVTVDGHTVVEDFSLTADQGTVTLAGHVDARSTYGGRISIAGGDGVTMAGTALLQAGATDATLGSGRVVLEAAGGQLNLQGGTIDVAGGEGGRVRLRARQSAGHDEIAVTALGATIVGARSAVLEGIAVYEGVSSVDAVKAQAIADANTFAGNAAAIAARLANGSVTLMPGIEIRSSGDLALDTDWNLFDSFGPNVREGGLTLRAAGNLVFNAHLSDGFDAAGRAGILQDTASWDLRLVSGADLDSASATALQPKGSLAQGSGSLVVGDATHGYLIRTGTGDIDVSVGRDLDLAHEESVIYTAGRRDTTVWSDFDTVPSRLLITSNFPQTISLEPLLTAAYGIDGGNLRVNAQGDVSSSLSAGGTDQFFNDWLLRLGREELDAVTGVPVVVSVDMPFRPGEQSTWFVDYAKFNQGVGALGGGNLSVNAGGNITDLLVALPTNGRVRGGRTAGETKTLELRNGGALNVVADGDIRGGQYYVGRGDGQLRANALTDGARHASTAPVLALGDATLGVATRGDLHVATVADPLMSFMRYANDARYDMGANMSGYTDVSALDLMSLGGDVVLGAEQMLGGRAPGSGTFNGQDLYPSKLHVTALSGSVSNELGRFSTYTSDQYAYNVDWSGLLFMMPSAQTDLRLLADKDVRLGQVVMSRLSPAAMPHPLNPMRDFAWMLRVWMYNDQGQSFGYPVNANVGDNWLINDHTPSRIYSRSGSIVREVSSAVSAGEQLWVRAGQDVRGLRINFRNNHRDDVSMVEAGNDVNGMTASNLLYVAEAAQFDVQGPGSLLISAGRDVYNVNAITLGNIQRWDANNFPEENSRINHLPDEGAAIHVMAGMKRQPDYAAFQNAYLDPAQVASMPGHLVTTLADGTRVPRYLLDAQEQRPGGENKTVQRGLVGYVAEVTGESLAPLDAWARFQSLPPLAQQVFMRRVFQQELREAGRNQNEPGVGGLPLNGGYNRGYEAIATLFPGDDWKGDVVSDSMTLRTMLGGDVSIFAPGGKFQVAALTRSTAPGEGVVTLAGGHVGIFANDSVVVNRSRVLTFVPEAAERGNDMIIWSTEGDVDAGRGAKTVRVPSKPVVSTDVDGNTTVKERSNMSGSGIGTVGSGDVDLIAPQGTINAGDAGIRVAGNLNLAALQVLNADNIEVEGEATGIPIVAAVNIGALTNASAAAAQATAAAQDVVQRERAAARQSLPSVFTVRVLGFGDEPAAGSPGARNGAAQPPGAGYNAQGVVEVLGQADLDASQLRQLTERERRGLGR